MITRQLNPQAIIIEDAETEIKVLVWSKYLKGYKKNEIAKGVKRAVDRVMRSLKSEQLKKDAYKSLYKYADNLWDFLIKTFGFNGKQVQDTVNFVMGARKQTPKEFAIPIQGMSEEAIEGYYESQEMGVPNDMYMKDYMRQVKEKTREFAKINALDPNDENNRNSLRNEAELVVRQEYHENQIKGFKESGVKLVVCSAHQDCSDRCAPWQGRIYSLDGSSGKTEDGKSYIPLEKATDIYYTTKKGKRYKNGLLGFNCRHRLYKYEKGMAIPHVDKETQQKENVVNTKQRSYERRIREAKTNALLAKNNGREEEYLRYRAKAIALNKEYQAFSRQHGRAYYPDRCSIFD